MPHAFSLLSIQYRWLSTSTSTYPLTRFYRESISLVPAHHFTELNEQKPGLAQPMMTLPLVNGADYLSSGRKHEASEEVRGEEEWKKRRNLHRCRLCNMSFSTGNALGGHMSYHAKQTSCKPRTFPGCPCSPFDSDAAFGNTPASGLIGSVKLSMNAFGGKHFQPESWVADDVPKQEYINTRCRPGSRLLRD